LTLRFDHDLFRDKEDGGRAFDPFLTQLNLSFSIGEQTLAALLGTGIARGTGIVPESRPFEDLEERQALESEVEGRRQAAARSGDRRPWSLSVSYSLIRSRPPTSSPNRQSVSWSLGFSPTDNWSLSWRTQYDLERGEFVDHSLNLRRDLHRWTASFQFLKASNGNFVFNFAVHLIDLSDVKFDYRQESARRR
jgi:hypothetical protein